jgi:hypothetical protein
MKSTVFVPVVAIGAQLVCGSPFATRALGGTVVIRQSAENGDAYVDTTVTIDLEGDRTPQALKGLSKIDRPLLTQCSPLLLDSSLPKTQIRTGNLDHVGRPVRHLRLYLRPSRRKQR